MGQTAVGGRASPRRRRRSLGRKVGAAIVRKFRKVEFIITRRNAGSSSPRDNRDLGRNKRVSPSSQYCTLLSFIGGREREAGKAQKKLALRSQEREREGETSGRMRKIPRQGTTFRRRCDAVFDLFTRSSRRPEFSFNFRNRLISTCTAAWQNKYKA